MAFLRPQARSWCPTRGRLSPRPAHHNHLGPHSASPTPLVTECNQMSPGSPAAEAPLPPTTLCSQGEDLKPPPRGHVPAEDRGEVPSELPKPSRAAAFAVATAHDRGYVRRLSEVCRVVRCSALPCAPSRGPDRDTSVGAACGWVQSAAPRPAVMSVALFCPGVRHHVSRQAIKTTFSGT